MPLTPEDVSQKRFSPVRFRDQGYDMGEVDQFLDEVEAELGRLIAENDDLRAKAGLAEGEAPAPTAAAPAQDAAEQDSPAAPAAEAPAATAPASEPEPALRVTTAAEASSAATRLLELATRNADEVVAEARQEAQQIVGSAREQADLLDREARTRSDNLDQETDTRRSELISTIEAERDRLDQEVDQLRAFEREYRSRLRSYFTQQLDALDGQGEGGELPAAHGHPQDSASDVTEPAEGRS